MKKEINTELLSYQLTTSIVFYIVPDVFGDLDPGMSSDGWRDKVGDPDSSLLFLRTILHPLQMK